MGIGQKIAQAVLGEENALYASSIGTTGALTVPRWEFFHDLAGRMPQKVQAVLDVGCGSGRQADVIARQRDMLAKDGVYIAVDCNPASMDFIRRKRPHLMDDKRLHFIEDFAQNARGRIQRTLQGRSLDASIVSIPHSLMSAKDIHSIWQMILDHSDEDSMSILYNVCSTRKRMQHYWEDVYSHPEWHAHTLWLPPWFQVNTAFGPKKKKSMSPERNGKPMRLAAWHEDLSYEWD